MKKALFVFLFASLLVVSCGSAPSDTDQPTELTLTGPETEAVYSRVELEEVGSSEVEFDGVVYKGVVLSVLLESAGMNPDGIKKVTAVATDGYQVTYSSEIVSRPDVLVAYATAEGDLTQDDGTFRMVLPGEPGNQNVRMLTELIID
jgi:hypothetical protein